MTEERKPPPVKTAKRPRFSHTKGRCWDSIFVMLDDGREIKGFYDATWGMYIYFEVDGRWLRVELPSLDLAGRVTNNLVWADLRGLPLPKRRPT